MARRPGIPQRPDEITVDWLRQALAFSGAFEPAQLRAVSIEPVGSGRGLLSAVVRCRLAWSSDAPQHPRSVIVKLHSRDRKTFRLARVVKLYRREYDFYRRIRPLAGVRTPEMLYADFAPFSHRFVMVLEDLGGLQSTSQADGASQVQARRAIRALARMHGRYWNNFNQPALRGVPDYTKKYRRLAQLGYMFNLAPALDRFGDRFTPRMRRLAEAYGPRIADHLAHISKGPKTFTHGDFRLDNLFFGSQGADDVAAVDWQNSGIHSGLRDVTYFLSTSVTPETRRAIEQDIVAEYHDALLAAGVSDYSLEECWRGYRQVMLSCLIGPVFICGSLDFHDEASRRTVESGLSRTLVAVEELNVEEFLPHRSRAFSVGNAAAALSAGTVRAYRKIGNLRRG